MPEMTGSGNGETKDPHISCSDRRQQVPTRARCASVTIVVSFRERWRFTATVIETILKNTTGDFHLWLLDSGMPDEVGDAVQPYVESGKLQIIEVGRGQQPHEARASIIPLLTSPYAVFIDNDALVAPGWLDSMVTCAEETGAGIVCPLYLWGDAPGSNSIHLAGGGLSFAPEDRGLRMTVTHRFLGRAIPEVEDDLRRQPCDFGEFHCLMMHRNVYSADGVFHADVVSVHEYIHACLRAKELGFETWFEPRSQINYLAFAPWLIEDIHPVRRRWDYVTAENSLRGFAERWGVVDDDGYRSSTLDFLTSHVGRADLLDVRPWLGGRRDETMSKADLQQTFGGWEWLAWESGYSIKDVQTFADAYCIAMELSDGVYRPCGRPLINHLVGTASVLLFYGCPMPIILAALLHSSRVSEHGSIARTNDLIEQVGQLGQAGKHAAKLVRLYSENPSGENLNLSGRGLSELHVDIAALYLLEAARDVDMHLSLEVSVSGRDDVFVGKKLDQCHALLRHVGLPGLAATLLKVRADSVRIPTVSFQGAAKGNFRFDGSEIVSA